MKKIKFLFDLGNVFFDWDPRHFYKDVFSNINEMEHFLSEICNDKWNIQQDAGRTIEEANSIEKDTIAVALGGLPPTKMHCSTMAAEGVKMAIENYSTRQKV